MDFYERRLRATLSAVYAAELSLNHLRTYRLSTALAFPRLRLLREDVGQPMEELRPAVDPRSYLWFIRARLSYRARSCNRMMSCCRNLLGKLSLGIFYARSLF